MFMKSVVRMPRLHRRINVVLVLQRLWIEVEYSPASWWKLEGHVWKSTACERNFERWGTCCKKQYLSISSGLWATNHYNNTINLWILCAIKPAKLERWFTFRYKSGNRIFVRHLWDKKIAKVLVIVYQIQFFFYGLKNCKLNLWLTSHKGTTIVNYISAINCRKMWIPLDSSGLVMF